MTIVCAMALQVGWAATLNKSGLWTDAATWQEGEPPQAPGAVLNTGTGAFAVKGLTTNAVIGSIRTDAATMPNPGGRTAFVIRELENGFSVTDKVTPTMPNGVTRWFAPTNALVLDNGASVATFDVGSPENAGNPFRYLLRCPVRLRSDLTINHAFPGNSTNQRYDLPAWAVYFYGTVSDDGLGKGLTVNMGRANVGVGFRPHNAFSGDVTVNRGLLRAIDASPVPGVECSPFGVSNKIYAVSGEAGVDLGGMTTGRGQELHLKGSFADVETTWGALVNLFATPIETADWRGKVVLEGDTGMGGSLGTSWYPFTAAGNILVSGPISETTPSKVTTLDGNLVFSGTNTFTGGIELKKGTFRATSREAFGTGPFVFNGGTYRYLAATDGDPFAGSFTVMDTAANIYVAEGIEYVPGLPPGANLNYFNKYGPGAFVLTNYVTSAGWHTKLWGGDLVYDLTAFSGNRGMFGNCVLIDFNGLSRIVVRGNAETAKRVDQYFNINQGTHLTYRLQDGQNLCLMYQNLTKPFVEFFESEGGGRFTNNKNATGKDYFRVNAFFGDSWASFDANGNVSACAVTNTDWAAGGLVDVIPGKTSLTVPDGTVVEGIRFNQSNGSDELVLTLAGSLTFAKSGAILVGSGMGATTVRVTGGTITCGTSGEALYFMNFNTNAPLHVASDIYGPGTTYLYFSGKGCTRLRGANHTSGYMYVTGGASLDIDSSDRLGMDGTGIRYLYLYDGTLVTHGSFDLAGDQSRLSYISVNAPGGTIEVAGKDDVLKYFEGTTDGNRQHSIGVHAYATLRKTGPGTFSPSTGPIPNIRVEEGSMGYIGYAAKIISENQGNLTAGNGVLLKGGNFIQPNSVRSGSATPEGPDGKKTFTVGPGGCVVDLLGDTLTWNYEWENGVVANASFFRGQDTIEIMSSVAGAKLSPNAYRDDNFEGTFKLNVPCISCVAVPRAEWRICKDITNDFIGVYANYSDLRFGCLTGEGHLNVKSAQTYLPGYFYIGRDRDETKYFDGSFCITYGAINCGSMQLIKVGSNAWGPRGGANRMDCPAVVRDGALLVANDSPATSGASGALGAAKIYVGDADTPSDAAPALLADGAFTVANEIRVHDTSPTNALPTIGGTAQADGATFSGAVTLYRDAAVRAEAGTTVSFTGSLTSNGHTLRKTGAGSVVMAFANGSPSLDLREGALSVTGDLTIAEGTALTIDDSVCTRENCANEYVLVSVTGGITGRYALTNTLPFGWRISYRGKNIVLRYDAGGTVLYIR